MAVAAVSAWASRSGGRCGASPVSAWARAVVAGDGGGRGERLGQQVGRQVRRQPGQRPGAGVVAGDGGGGGQRLGQHRWLLFIVYLAADHKQGIKLSLGIRDTAGMVKSSPGRPHTGPDQLPKEIGGNVGGIAGNAGGHQRISHLCAE